MCVSLGGPAEFSGTQLHASKLEHPFHGLIDTLGYSVKASASQTNQRDAFWQTATNQGMSGALFGQNSSPAPTGRALFIALPTMPGTFGPNNLVDTTNFKDFIKDQTAAVNPVRLRSASFAADFSTPKGVSVSECGMFTVVTATNATDISTVLHQGLVPSRKRPNISPDFLQHVDHLCGGRHGWSFVLACFDSSEETQATFFLWYKSQLRDHLYFPGLDEHSGDKLPQPGELVTIDHVLTASVPGMVGGYDVHYTQQEAVIASGLIPSRVRGFWGKDFPNKIPNGDFVISVNALQLPTRFPVLRVMPPSYDGPPEVIAQEHRSWGS